MDRSAPGHGRLEIVIADRLDEIGRVASALDEFAARFALPADAVIDMQVALDEVLANVVSYAYPEGQGGAHRIRIVLAAHPDALEAEVTDDGAPFDPAIAGAPERDAPLEHRRIGGLGLHFVRNLMSEVKYQRIGSHNRLVLRRRLRGSDGGSLDQ
ncbi:MAG: ATP-binding protein [Burkholderiales bacterium]|nr:MAG: ATP-binding protein [Burkholderiales bacterium]